MSSELETSNPTKDARGPEEKALYCSFCGKSQHEVQKMIVGPTVFICDECVELCMDIVQEERKALTQDGLDSSDIYPTHWGVEIPSELITGADAISAAVILETLQKRLPEKCGLTQLEKLIGQTALQLGKKRILMIVSRDLAAANEALENSQTEVDRLSDNDSSKTKPLELSALETYLANPEEHSLSEDDCVSLKDRIEALRSETEMTIKHRRILAKVTYLEEYKVRIEKMS